MFVSIEELGLTQMYLNQEKIEKNQQLLQQTAFEKCPPITVYEIFPGKLHIIDGHTRAFLLQQEGLKEIPAEFLPATEIDDEIMGPFYQACSKWCQKAGLLTINDLATRILPADEFLQTWIVRCQQKISLIEQGQTDHLLAKQCQLLELSGLEALALDEKGQVITEGLAAIKKTPN